MQDDSEFAWFAAKVASQIRDTENPHWLATIDELMYEIDQYLECINIAREL